MAIRRMRKVFGNVEYSPAMVALRADKVHWIFEANYRDYVLAAAGYVHCHACWEKVGNGWIFCLHCAAPVTITGLQRMLLKDRSWATHRCDVHELVKSCVNYVEAGAFNETSKRIGKGIQRRYQTLLSGVTSEANPVDVGQNIAAHLREVKSAVQTQGTEWDRKREIQHLRPQIEDWRTQNLAIEHDKWRKRCGAASGSGDTQGASGNTVAQPENEKVDKDPDHLTAEEIAALPLCPVYGDTKQTADLVSNRAIAERYHKIWKTGRVRHYDAFVECAHYRETCQQQGIGKYFCMRLTQEKAALNGLSIEPLHPDPSQKNYLTSSQSIIDRMLFKTTKMTCFLRSLCGSASRKISRGMRS